MFTLGYSWNFLYLYLLYTGSIQKGKNIFFSLLYAVIFACYWKKWTLKHSCVIRDVSHILHLQIYKINRSEKCPLIIVRCSLKYKCSECDTSVIAQECLNDHFFEQHTHFFTVKESIFCALQDIRFIHMTFTGVVFKIYSILFETILLVIMIYILRIIIYLCLTRFSLKVYMIYI